MAHKQEKKIQKKIISLLKRTKTLQHPREIKKSLGDQKLYYSKVISELEETISILRRDKSMLNRKNKTKEERIGELENKIKSSSYSEDQIVQELRKAIQEHAEDKGKLKKSQKKYLMKIDAYELKLRMSHQRLKEQKETRLEKYLKD